MAETKKRGGGPKSPEGKARSSQNSLKHGGRSETLVLPWEQQADFDKVAEGWRKEFEPEGYHEERLVEILVRNDWFFRRADQRWQQAEAAKADDHTLALMQRYRTTAERSFFRALGAVRTLKKDLMKLDDDRTKLQARAEGSDKLIAYLLERLKAAGLDRPTEKAQKERRRRARKRSSRCSSSGWIFRRTRRARR